MWLRMGVGRMRIDGQPRDMITTVLDAFAAVKAFQRVALEPGEIKTVTFEIPVANCTIVDPDANRVVEPGEFELPSAIRVVARTSSAPRSPWRK